LNETTVFMVCDVFSVCCSELLQQADRKLDDQFLELERKLLEKALRASSDDPSAPPTSTADSAPSQNLPEASRTISSSYSSSDSYYTPMRGDVRSQAQESNRDERPAEVAAEWWTMGQNSLMDGALAGLQGNYEPLYQGAQTHAAHAFLRYSLEVLEGAAESFVRRKVPLAGLVLGALRTPVATRAIHTASLSRCPPPSSLFP
jgi:hypothetical protein